MIDFIEQGTRMLQVERRRAMLKEDAQPVGRRWVVWHGGALACLVVLLTAPTLADSKRTTAHRVNTLIARLGASEYTLREQAREELKQLGPQAFDPLLEAQYSDDAEISLAARRLLGQFQVRWVQKDDPEIVRHALRDYHRLSQSQRAARGEWLALQEDGLASRAICRIARYEPDEVVAKRTVLIFLDAFDPQDPARLPALREAIQAELGDSQRRPVTWLRLRAQPQQPAATWKELAAAEFQLRDKARSSHDVCCHFLRYSAERTRGPQGVADPKTLLERFQTLVPGKPTLALQSAHWLLDQELWDVFSAFAENLAASDRDNPEFAYCLAEYHLAVGDAKQATAQAEAAFALTADQTRFPDPLVTGDARFRAAVRLEHRGHVTWALAEYNRIAEQRIVHWHLADLRDRSLRLAAELLHDQERETEAADTLAKLFVEEDDDELPEGGEELPDVDLDIETRGLLSRMHFFRAQQAASDGDREQAVARLRKAVEADPTDADVLIAMYRLPHADDAWKKETRAKIKAATKTFASEISKLKARGVVANRGDIAMALNQVAWLVGNTEGDQQRAIRWSRESLELQPNSGGSLDTLARTYYAVGDVDQALKYQRRAVKLLPHSRQLQRQLKMFEQAAAGNAR